MEHEALKPTVKVIRVQASAEEETLLPLQFNSFGYVQDKN